MDLTLISSHVCYVTTYILIPTSLRALESAVRSVPQMPRRAPTSADRASTWPVVVVSAALTDTTCESTRTD